MLALARGEGQSIIIDGHIEVKVVKWSRSSVRLAIQRPREVRVDREEIWRKENPGKPTPLEVAERERQERFARDQLASPTSFLIAGDGAEVTFRGPFSLELQRQIQEFLRGLAVAGPFQIHGHWEHGRLVISVNDGAARPFEVAIRDFLSQHVSAPPFAPPPPPPAPH